MVGFFKSSKNRSGKEARERKNLSREERREEPAISKAKVYLKDNTGKVIAEAITDSSGDYKLEDVPAGSYRLYVEADKKFRYMCRSREEFRAVKEGYDVLLEESSKMDIGLMEGFLTSPFYKNRSTFVSYVDLDPTKGIRDW
ncbi:MAG: carboxypeptidase-like regulatory domain-containing protein, partial [Candidatus Omnitrophica bacterium]|nr:carboxypeptidase-like regulatory domain-containing protein [Candidatus Omnitrophota bacterium]